MKIKVSYLSLRELGQRSNQEDSLWPDVNSVESTAGLFILCDGMGGHEAGEVASQTVCSSMSEYVLTHYAPESLFTEEDFKKTLDAAYDALDSKDNGAERKMGTTLTFVKLHEGGCFVAHIGDSRVYIIRPSEKRILYVTRDHSLVNELVELGEMTPEEAKVSNQKNVITRAMQPLQPRRMRADCRNFQDILPGDYIYMCSDGMLEVSEDEEIVNVLSMNVSDEEKMKIFKEVTINNRDNHSAHLIHILDVEQTEDVAAPPVVAPAEESSNQIPEVSSKKFWSWHLWAVCLAVIGFLCFYFFIPLKHKDAKEPDPNVSEDTTVRSDTTARSDTLSSDTLVPGDTQGGDDTGAIMEF